jgi:hypothetical protein
MSQFRPAGFGVGKLDGPLRAYKLCQRRASPATTLDTERNRRDPTRAARQLLGNHMGYAVRRTIRIAVGAAQPHNAQLRFTSVILLALLKSGHGVQRDDGFVRDVRVGVNLS